jgi:hypothetical protein
MSQSGSALYGLMARFPDADGLLAAVRDWPSDLGRPHAYTPFPLPGLDEALGLAPDRLGWWALAGGLFGGLSALGIQWYSAVIDYPINVGGRPPFSLPAFLPITVILTLFWAAAATALGYLIGNRLPRLSHPVFGAPGFADATRDGFFLLVRAGGESFNAEQAGARLAALGAESVQEVPA